MNRSNLNYLALGAVAMLAGCTTTAASSGDPQPHFSSLYSTYLANCAQCHAPGAVGATSTTEKSLDFATQAAAYTSLSGTATGLTGNQQACNGVAFVVKDKPASSLLLAVLDSATRTAIDLTATPNCDHNAISDMALKMGTPPSAAFLTALNTWIANGAPND